MITAAANKPRFARKIALKVAEDLRRMLASPCERIEYAGSLRRGKATVGDVEIIYVPKIERLRNPGDMFEWIDVNLTDQALLVMERAGILSRRLNTLGRETYGPKNKLMIHCPSGLPVDFFATTEDNWANCLTHRTGPADLIVRICQEAQRRGLKYDPYGPGFINLETGAILKVISEQEVFDIVGMPFEEPEHRI